MATPLRWLIVLAPLAFVMVMSFGMNRLSTGTLQAWSGRSRWAMGLAMSTIFLVYTASRSPRPSSAVSAGFAGLACGGIRPRRTCRGFGTSDHGRVGLLVAMVVNTSSNRRR